MKKLLYYALPAIFIGIFGLFTVVQSASPNFFLLSNNFLRPISSLWGLRVSQLGSTGSPCVVVGTTGIFSTSTCGGGMPLSTGVTGYIARWSSSTNLSTSTIFDDGVKVGIGTSTPSQLLTVGNNNQFTVDTLGSINGIIATINQLKLNSAINAFNTTDTGSNIYTSNGSGAAYPFLTSGNLVLQSRATGAPRDIVFANDTSFGSTTAVQMVIQGSSGYVGIGTTSPANLLQIYGTTGNTPQLNLQNTSPTSYTDMQYTGSGRTYFTGVGNASETQFGVANKWFVFDNVAGLMRLVVDTAGNIGIGTTSPGNLLHIYGLMGVTPGINIQNTSGGNAYTQMAFTGTGRQWQVGVGNAAETGLGVPNKFFIYDQQGAGVRLAIDTLGNVGIGTTTPGYKLDVYNGAVRAQDFLIGSSSTPPNIVYVGDSLTVGFLGTHPYDFYITPPLWNGQTFTSQNIGVNGRTIATMYQQAPVNLNPKYNLNSGMNIAVIWGGTNDLANAPTSTASSTYSYLKVFSQHERSLGFKTLVATTISRVGLDTAKNSYNGLIRANWPTFADGIVDLAANANLGADGAYASTTWFNADQVHLTDAGYALVGSLVQTGITNLVNNNQTFAPNLNVTGNLSLTGALFDSINATGTVGQILTSTGTSTIWSSTSTLATSLGAFVQGGNSFGATGTLGTLDNFGLNFITNSTTKMTILPNGNVGIGTVNPVNALDINGTISRNGGGTSTSIISGSGIQLINPSGAVTVLRMTQTAISDWTIVNRASIAALDFSFGGSPLMTILGNGNVGIGTTSPAYKLDLYGTAGSPNIFNISSSSNGSLFSVVSAPDATLTVASSTSSNYYFKINNKGISASSTVPTVSSCGTTPSIVGSNSNFTVTVGSVSATTCTVTFNPPYTNTPVCTVSSQTGTIAVGYTKTNTAIVLTNAALTGDVVDVICIGRSE